MEAPFTPESVRATLSRSGLDLPDERVARLAAAIDSARAAGRTLTERDFGYLGPPVFRAPEPEARER